MNWIGADQQRGIRAALNSESGADVMKSAAAGVQIVVRVIGFDVLVEAVEQDMAARDDFAVSSLYST